MDALTVLPATPRSAALRQVSEPDEAEGRVLVETLAVGVCGTDREIVDGEYGSAPPGDDFLVLGHEALGRVLEAPAESSLRAGDLVAPMVRRPDPVPCGACAVGEQDMCRNGLYTEHGIKELHGFCRERFREDEAFLVPVPAELATVGALVEPASILAKAWEHVERVGRRAHWAPRRCLVTGAGPVGLLAALLGRARGLEVHVMDIVDTGPKPELVRDLGGHYFVRDVIEACHGADVVIECTGVGQVVFDAMQCTPPGGIVCLTGISSGGRPLEADMAAVNKRIVLQNDVVLGTVNANRRHYEAAVAALAAADRGWLERLITRREPPDRWAAALERHDGDVKTLIEWQ